MMLKLLSSPMLQARTGHCFRIIVTADSREILQDLRHVVSAVHSLEGKNDVFIGMEGSFTTRTPDGRIGGMLLACSVDKSVLVKRFTRFILDVILPLPTASCYDASLNPKEIVPIGRDVASIGTRWKTKTTIDNRVIWAIPVFDGDFMIQHGFGLMECIHRIAMKVMGRGRLSTLAVVKSMIEKGQNVEGVIFVPSTIARRVIYLPKNDNPPFNVVMKHQYCPRLMTAIEDTKVPAGADTVYLTSLFAISKEAAENALKTILALIEDEESIIGIEFVTETGEKPITIDLTR